VACCTAVSIGDVGAEEQAKTDFPIVRLGGSSLAVGLRKNHKLP
jgi:hypothetical protein